MTIGITVTGDALLGYVLTVTDADQGDLVHVYRVDLSGHYENTPVRGLDMATPTGDTMVVVDYEAPFNVDVRYTAEAYETSDLITPVASADSGLTGTTLPYGFAIISDPLEQSLRIAVNMTELDPWDNEARVLGKHQVLGRKNTVMNLDVESGRSGGMKFTNVNGFAVDWDDSGPYLPYDVLSHSNYRTVFRQGRKLMFRNDWTRSLFDDMYFAVTSRSTQLVHGLAPGQGTPILQFSLGYEEQDQPTTSLRGIGLGNWNLVDSANASWDEVKTKHNNWFSVFLNPGL